MPWEQESEEGQEEQGQGRSRQQGVEEAEEEAEGACKGAPHHRAGGLVDQGLVHGPRLHGGRAGRIRARWPGGWTSGAAQGAWPRGGALERAQLEHGHEAQIPLCKLFRWMLQYRLSREGARVVGRVFVRHPASS